MDFKEFQSIVLQEMQEANTDLRFSIQDIEKLQGQSYTGLMVGREGSTITASINIDQFYEELQSGTDLETVLGHIQDIARTEVERIPEVDLYRLTDYEYMKSYLTMQMVPVSGNEKKLEEIPHQIIGDIATVYRFELESDSEKTSTILVTNAMLSTYDISAEKLHEDALVFAPKYKPAVLRNLGEVLKELSNGVFDIPETEVEMYFASVKGSVNGSAVINYPGFMEMASEKLGGDLYVLPSSIHELILLPDNGMASVEELNMMIREINGSEVRPEERLSDNAYHYDSSERILELAESYEERIRDKEEYAR